MLTHNQLLKKFNYDAITGKFYKKLKNNKIKLSGCLTKQGYIEISYNYKIYQAHRLAWFYYYGQWPLQQIDHINHIKNDNRIQNLRCVSLYENQKNRRKRTANFTGVYWKKDKQRWIASIKVNQKSIHLGSFKTEYLASVIRKAAEGWYGFHPNHGS